MDLLVSDAVRDRYPDLRIGIVVARQLNNAVYSEELIAATQEAFSAFAGRVGDVKALDEEKNIRIWREVYQSFGANPKKKVPTAEALLSRVVKSRFVPHISPAVDSYLMAETLCALPIGGYDVAKIEGDITLRFSGDAEKFIGIGSGEEEALPPGEVVYADATRILTRRWNYKDCDHAKICAATKSVILFVEAPRPEISSEEIERTTNAIAQNLSNYCKADVRTLFLGTSLNRIELIKKQALDVFGL